MSDGYDINEGECYRHIWTHVLVRITKVRWHAGISGLVYWETLNETKIDGVTSGIQEAQHFPGRLLPCTHLPRYCCVKRVWQAEALLRQIRAMRFCQILV
jgi:hypothetical protein